MASKAFRGLQIGRLRIQLHSKVSRTVKLALERNKIYKVMGGGKNRRRPADSGGPSSGGADAPAAESSSKPATGQRAGRNNNNNNNNSNNNNNNSNNNNNNNKMPRGPKPSSNKGATDPAPSTKFDKGRERGAPAAYRKHASPAKADRPQAPIAKRAGSRPNEDKSANPAPVVGFWSLTGNNTDIIVNGICGYRAFSDTLQWASYSVSSVGGGTTADESLLRSAPWCILQQKTMRDVAALFLPNVMGAHGAQFLEEAADKVLGEGTRTMPTPLAILSKGEGEDEGVSAASVDDAVVMLEQARTCLLNAALLFVVCDAVVLLHDGNTNFGDLLLVKMMRAVQKLKAEVLVLAPQKYIASRIHILKNPTLVDHRVVARTVAAIKALGVCKTPHLVHVVSPAAVGFGTQLTDASCEGVFDTLFKGCKLSAGGVPLFSKPPKVGRFRSTFAAQEVNDEATFTAVGSQLAALFETTHHGGAGREATSSTCECMVRAFEFLDAWCTAVSNVQFADVVAEAVSTVVQPSTALAAQYRGLLARASAGSTAVTDPQHSPNLAARDDPAGEQDERASSNESWASAPVERDESDAEGNVEDEEEEEEVESSASEEEDGGDPESGSSHEDESATFKHHEDLHSDADDVEQCRGEDNEKRDTTAIGDSWEDFVEDEEEEDGGATDDAEVGVVRKRPVGHEVTGGNADDSEVADALEAGVTFADGIPRLVMLLCPCGRYEYALREAKPVSEVVTRSVRSQAAMLQLSRTALTTCNCCRGGARDSSGDDGSTHVLQLVLSPSVPTLFSSTGASEASIRNPAVWIVATTGATDPPEGIEWYDHLPGRLHGAQVGFEYESLEVVGTAARSGAAGGGAPGLRPSQKFVAMREYDIDRHAMPMLISGPRKYAAREGGAAGRGRQSRRDPRDASHGPDAGDDNQELFPRCARLRRVHVYVPGTTKASEKVSMKTSAAGSRAKFWVKPAIIYEAVNQLKSGHQPPGTSHGKNAAVPFLASSLNTLPETARFVSGRGLALPRGSHCVMTFPHFVSNSVATSAGIGVPFFSNGWLDVTS